MTKLLFRTFTFFMAAALLLAACDFSNANPSGAVSQQITQTMQAVATDAQATLSAAQPTVVVQVITTTPAPTEAMAATATLLPTGTPLPTQPPAPTAPPVVAPTAAPAFPTAHLNQDTNCRLGPSTDFAIVFSAKAGTDLQVVSKTDLSNYLIVNSPNKSGQTCWLWTQNATVTGDLSGLPVASTPPTPTSARSFTVSFYRIESCGGSQPAFKIVNTGSGSWQSYTLVVKDRTSKTTETSNDNVFDKRSACSVIKSIDLLDPGETGFAYGDSFSYDLDGHTMRATLTLCSHNDQGGVCLDQVIDFTP